MLAYKRKDMYYNQQNLEEFTDGRLSVLAVEFYKSFLIIIRVKKPCSHLCSITVNLSIHYTFFP